MHRSLKRNLVIGAAALAVAAFAGGAYAATQNSGPATRQAFLNDIAKRLHVTPEQLSSALNGAYLDQLQAAVNAGRLTQAQANALEQRLKQKGTAPALPFGGFGFGHRAFPGPGRLGGGIGLMAGPGSLHAAANYLGLTDAQLFQQLSSGKSLAQIAAAKGKSVNGLEQTMSSAAKAALDKLVAGKVITAAQEQRMLARLNTRLSAGINQKGLPFKPALRPRLRFPNGGAGAPYGVPGPPTAPTPAPGTLPLPYAAPAPSA
ncbi:MAG: hypothetical protein JO243_22580 [Solirubrobacterales bacterium]|nr:hypothetical protein [Solirubrobacterales bacterium]